MVVNAGNVELLCYTMTRLEAAIGHPKELYPFDLAKARDVAVADVPTCTDKTYANFFLSHAKPPSRTSATAPPARPARRYATWSPAPGGDGLTSVPRGEGHEKGGVGKAVPQRREIMVW